MKSCASCRRSFKKLKKSLRSQTTVSVSFSFQGLAKLFLKTAKHRIWSQFVPFLCIFRFKSYFSTKTRFQSTIISENSAVYIVTPAHVDVGSSCAVAGITSD